MRIVRIFICPFAPPYRAASFRSQIAFWPNVSLQPEVTRQKNRAQPEVDGLFCADMHNFPLFGNVNFDAFICALIVIVVVSLLTKPDAEAADTFDSVNKALD